MSFREMLIETRKVSENDIKAMGQIEQRETSGEVKEAVPAEKPEITSELVAGLIKEVPELEGIDPEKLLAGAKIEFAEHSKNGTISDDEIGVGMAIRIAADHIKEFPEADYYAALAAMEASLVPPPAEEVPAEEAPAAEEVPAEEEVVEEPVAEEEVEEAKKAKVPGVKATKTDKLTKVKK